MRAVKYLPVLALFFALTIGINSYAATFTTSPKLDTFTADDVGNLTLTGRDNWDSQGANTPSLTINGSSSGNTVIKSSAAASGTLTLPAATDTLAINGTLAPTGTISPQGVAFSTVQSGNPLMLMTVQNIPVASVNAGYSFLSGVTNRVIFPGTPTVMVSGTAASATGVYIACGGGTNNYLASWPIADLVTLKPVNPFASVSGGTYPTTGTAFASGCPSGSGLYVSVVGSALTTTTNLYINLPYTLQ